MLKIIIKDLEGVQNIDILSKEKTLFVKESQQIFFDNLDAKKYSFNLLDGENSIELKFLDKNGEYTHIKLENMANLIKKSYGVKNENLKTVLGIINDDEGMNELEQTVLNPSFQGNDIISNLKELLSKSEQDEENVNGIIIDDFGSLVEALESSEANENKDDVNSLDNSLDIESIIFKVMGREKGFSLQDKNDFSNEKDYMETIKDVEESNPDINPTPNPIPDLEPEPLPPEPKPLPVPMPKPIPFPETEDSEVEINEGTIRLDEAPEYGTIQIQIDGEWFDMEVGKEYPKNLPVKFVPDSEKIDEETKDFFVGTKDPSKASLSDWGEVNGDIALFKQNGVTITTKLSGSQDIILHKGNRPAHGIGIGDANDKDGNGLSRGETLTVAVDGENINQISFHLAGLGHRFDENDSKATKVVIKAYDKNGNLIEVQSGYRDPNSENIYESTYTFSMNGENSSKIAYFVLGTDGGSGTFVVRNMTLSKTVYDNTEFTTTQPDGSEESINKDINLPNSNKDEEISLGEDYIPPVKNDNVEFSFESQLKDENLDSIEIIKFPESGKLTLLDGTEIKEGDFYLKDTKFKYIKDEENSFLGDEIIFKGVDSSTGEKSDETSLIIKNEEQGFTSKILCDDIDIESIISFCENKNSLELESSNINFEEVLSLENQNVELRFSVDDKDIIFNDDNYSSINLFSKNSNIETFDEYLDTSIFENKYFIENDIVVNPDI